MPRRADANERCCTHVLHCGGDLGRVVERRGGTLEQFARHLARIRGLDEGGPPLVMLTRTNPLGLAVLQTRRALEEAVPALGEAAWLIFVDDRDDPFFMQTASRMGSLVGGVAAPLWFAPHHQRFLVLGDRELDAATLRGRFAQLGVAAKEEPPADSQVRVTPPGAGAPTPPPLDYAAVAGAGRG